MGNSMAMDDNFVHFNNLQPILQENFIRDHRNEDIYSHYDQIDVIGQGSNGVVSRIRKKNMRHKMKLYTSYLCDFFGLPPDELSALQQQQQQQQQNGGHEEKKKKQKKRVYALKTIDFEYVNEQSVDELRNEISILRTLDHPGIIKAYATFERKSNVAVVMELCSGGDLYTRTPYTEEEAAGIMLQLLSAVGYMHERGFIHCDLKFENILFESKKPDAKIRLIDFGLSKHYGNKDQWATGSSGTIYTMAPEVFDAEYTSQTDMWSMGVLAFMLLSNKMPFWGKSVLHVMERIVECDYSFEEESWVDVSSSAKEFVSALINVDPEARLDAKEALDTAWLREDYPLPDEKPSKQYLNAVQNAMSQYGNGCDFKKLVYMIVAYGCSVEETLKLRRLFEHFNSAHDGLISFDEFRDAFNDGLGTYLDEMEAKRMFRGADMNADGLLHYTEFLAATMETIGLIDDEKLEDAFEFLDWDRTGYISKQNIKFMLGKCYTQEIGEKLLNEVDLDGKGYISYQDFYALFHQSKSKGYY